MMSKLNLKELSILLLITEGKSIKDIAQIYGLPRGDVELRVYALLEKFEVSNLSDLSLMFSGIDVSSFLVQK